MPASENGAIADVHVTAFQSSIDALLQSGRLVQGADSKLFPADFPI